MQLCRVEHFYNIFVLTFGLNTIAITPKSEDKYVEKVFNLTELHFSEVISFKIGTLEMRRRVVILWSPRPRVRWTGRFTAIEGWPGTWLETPKTPYLYILIFTCPFTKFWCSLYGICFFKNFLSCNCAVFAYGYKMLSCFTLLGIKGTWLSSMYTYSPHYAHFGSWKKWGCVKIALVGL